MLREMIILKALEMGGLLSGQPDPVVESLAGECEKVVQIDVISELAPEMERIAARAAEVVHRTAKAEGCETPEAYLCHILDSDQTIATLPVARRTVATMSMF